MQQEALSMYDSMEPIERQAIPMEVADRLLALISAGQLKPGDRLPPERDLAARLHVGRTTVREALRHLSMSGLLESKRGSGTYVSHDFNNRVVEQIGWSLYLNANEVQELFELRKSLEILAAQLAAERATVEEKARISVYREWDAIQGRDYERETDIDLAFHEAIAQASHNRLLIRLMFSMRNLIRRYIENSIKMRREMRTTYSEHKAICDAIQGGQPAEAARAMESHLTTSHHLILEHLASGGGGDRT